MKNPFKYLVLCWLCCWASYAASQKENNIWYFGAQAGLNFSVSPPAVLTNGMLTTSEGCASIADANGNLLFYTDGSTIYNAQHTTMANGSGLFGHSSTTQAAVIVKKPGSSTIYYVFSLGAGGTGALNYSTVDMSLSMGSGSVIAKNATLAASPCSEKMTSVKHCNGVDFWLVAHGMGNSDFMAFLVTNSGVSGTPVVSSTGSSYSGVAFCGNMKISPNGSKLGVAIQAPVHAFELFDFNNASGAVTNSLSLGSFTNAYGCEFSPDGSKFYGSREYGTGSMALYQWDLCAGSNNAIIASEFSIPTGSNIYGMQLATDGKIYVARMGSTLAVVHNPNALGSACSYTHNGLSISPKSCNFNLPNFVTSGFMAPLPPFTFTVSNSFGCQSAAFTPPSVVSNTSSSFCSATGSSVTGLSWFFGNPASGSSNTSTLSNPVHAFTTLGTFTVSMVVHYSCGGTDTVRQAVNVNLPCISVSSTSITCATLGSATVATTGGIGPFSYTWMPGNQTGSVATGLNPGTYTLTVFDFGNNFTYTANTIFTSLIPLTANVQFQPSVACNGASTASATVINIAGGSGNEYYLWTNGSLNYTVPTVTALAAGLWSATVTDALTGCKVNDIFFITQPPPITLQMSSSSPSVCVSHTAALHGIAAGGTPGYTYSWTSGPAQQGFTVTNISAGTFTYILTATDTLGCKKSAPVSLLFVASPAITVANHSICPLETGTLIASGATSYTWNNGTTGNSFTANPSSSSAYTVTGSASGCTTTTVGLIVLKPVPLPLISSNSPRCETSMLQLFASGGASYVWSGPQNFSGSGSNTTHGPLVSGNAGVYHVTVTAANSCTAAVFTSVVVNPTPTLSAGASTVCTTQTLMLSASSAPGATYQWTGPFGYSSAQQNPSVVFPALSAGGSYSVIATSVESCTNQAVVNASVVTPPSLTLASSSNTFCAQAFGFSPTTVTLFVNGAGSYTLTYSPNLVAAGSAPVYQLQTQAPFLPVLAPASVTLTGSNGICSSTATTSYSIIPNPVVSILSQIPVICAGDSFTFEAAGASTYTWNSPANFAALPGGTKIITNPPMTSVYAVVGQSLGCISDEVGTQLTVNPIPTVFVDPAGSLLCLNNTATLQASGTATDFHWQPATYLNTISGALVLSTPPADQAYTVTGTALNCTNQAVASITVLALPVPAANSSRKEVCVNEPVTLSGTGGLFYHWIGPNGFFYNGTPVTFTLAHPGMAGDYTLVATDNNNCQGKTTVGIGVNMLPEGVLQAATFEECAPFCQEFVFVTNDSNVIAQAWNITRPGGALAAKTAGKEFSFCFTSPGTYTITGQLRDENTTCKSTAAYFVKAYEKPVAGFEWTPRQPVEMDDEVEFRNTSIGAEQTAWTWSFAHAQQLATKGQSTSLLFSEAGNYPVVMVVGNKWGCSDTSIHVIGVLPAFALYMPNAFTPNADGNNETLKPVIHGTNSNYGFQVFNRWGERLFLAQDPSEGWDGSYQGVACKEDSYVWLIQLSAGGENKKFSGTVLLYR